MSERVGQGLVTNVGLSPPNRQIDSRSERDERHVFLPTSAHIPGKEILVITVEYARGGADATGKGRIEALLPYPVARRNRARRQAGVGVTFE